MQMVGLLDCNNFFVSCERLFRPDLVKRPVVVLSSNDGCVVARSQEVKDKGIPMGVPYFKVKDSLQECDAAIFSNNFTLYRDISRRVMNVLKDRYGQVEQYSIDEAFFSLPEAIAESESWALKQLVEKLVGIPVSIGVGTNKTIAKVASHKAKSGSGIYCLTPKQWQTEIVDLPLGQIWGVGAGRQQEFAKHGLETAGQLLVADRARVERLFGVAGVRLQAELQGKLVYRLVTQRLLQKSLMSTRSFRESTTNKTIIEDAVAYHIRRVAEDLRAMKAVTGALRVMIRPGRYSDFALQGGSQEVHFESPTQATEQLLESGMELVNQLFKPDVPYKKAGVLLSEVKSIDSVQVGLFDSANQSLTGLNQSIDKINQKYGLDTIGFGRRLKTKMWQSGREHISTVSTTNWHKLPIVSAK